MIRRFLRRQAVQRLMLPALFDGFDGAEKTDEQLAIEAWLWEQAGGADVVISHCRFTGEPIPAKYCNPRRFDREALRERGIFPITVLARRNAILEHGGFWTTDRYEDWALWNRMADGGCRFVVVPKVTWTYRREGWDNRTDGSLR